MRSCIVVRWSNNSGDITLSYGIPVRPINVDPALIAESRKKTAERLEAIKKAEIEKEIQENCVDLGIGVLWAKSNSKARYLWYPGEYVSLHDGDSAKGETLPLSHYYARVPTIEELDALVEKCTWTEVIENDVNGYKVTGPNGNSIFIPCGGYESGNQKQKEGEACYLWSSTNGFLGINKAISIKNGKVKKIKGSMNNFNIRHVFVAPDDIVDE